MFRKSRGRENELFWKMLDFRARLHRRGNEWPEFVGMNECSREITKGNRRRWGHYSKREYHTPQKGDMRLVYWRLWIVWGHPHPIEFVCIMGGCLECSANTIMKVCAKSKVNCVWNLYFYNSNLYTFWAEMVLNPDSVTCYFVISSNSLNLSDFSFSTVNEGSDI